MATSHIEHNKQEDENLERLALEEIMKETKRARERAQTMGPMGWVKCPLQPTNKRFFRNILMGTMANPKCKPKTTKDCKRGRKQLLNTSRTVLDTNDSRTSKSKTQSDQHPFSRSCDGNSPESSSAFLTEKYSKRNIPSCNKKDKEKSSMKEILPNNSPRDISDKEHKSSGKHKLKHKSKHKHKKKKKM